MKKIAWILAMVCMFSMANGEKLPEGLYMATTLESAGETYDVSALAPVYLYADAQGKAVWMDRLGFLETQETEDGILLSGIPYQVTVQNSGFSLKGDRLTWLFAPAENMLAGRYRADSTQVNGACIPLECTGMVLTVDLGLDGDGMAYNGEEPMPIRWTEDGTVYGADGSTWLSVSAIEDGLEIVKGSMRLHAVRDTVLPSSDATVQEDVVGVWTLMTVKDTALDVIVDMPVSSSLFWVDDQGNAAWMEKGQCRENFKQEGDILRSEDGQYTAQAENGVLLLADASTSQVLVWSRMTDMWDLEWPAGIWEEKE